jgi:hypothetical protein
VKKVIDKLQDLVVGKEPDRIYIPKKERNK